MQSDELKREWKGNLRERGILLSLCGVLVCSYLGFGLGRVVCHGLLMAALGAPMRNRGSLSRAG